MIWGRGLTFEEEATDRFKEVKKGGNSCAGADCKDGSSFLSGGARLVMQIFVRTEFS